MPSSAAVDWASTRSVVWRNSRGLGSERDCSKKDILRVGCVAIARIATHPLADLAIPSALPGCGE